MHVVMLTDEHKELLAAYVDGELSSQELSQAEALLQGSRPARKFVKQLEGDSRRLTALPKDTLPTDFSEQIVNTIVEQGLDTGTFPALPDVPAAAPAPVVAPAPSATVANSTPQSSLPDRPQSVPSIRSSNAPSTPWAAWALAALVFLAVVVASFSYFASGRKKCPQEGLVEQPRPRPKPRQKQPPKKQLLPKARVRPLLEFAAAEYRKRDTWRKLVHELQNDNAFQFEVQCLDQPKTVKRLQKGLESCGIQLLGAPKSKKRKKGTGAKKRQSYIVFMEDVYDHELDAIFKALGATKGSNKTPVRLVQLSKLPADRRSEVAKFLGVSADQLKPPPQPREKKEEGGPLLNPAVHVPPKKNGAKNGDAKKPAGPQRRKRAAVMLATNVASGDRERATINRFLKARRTARPGTKQIVFVLHDVSV